MIFNFDERNRALAFLTQEHGDDEALLLRGEGL